MDEMIEAVGREVTDGVMRAREIHAGIIASKKQVAIGIFELAEGLKTMRDEELYKELGYGDFQSYCEKMAKVNASQAYKYIKVYEELGTTALQSAGGMGIEKLFLVTQLPPAERCDAIAEPETIEGMSVKELRAFVAKARQQGEQLSFLQNEAEAADSERRETEEKYQRLLHGFNEQVAEITKKKDIEIEALNKEIRKVRLDSAKMLESMTEKLSEERQNAGRKADEKELQTAREEGRKAGVAEGEEELARQKKMFEELQEQLSGAGTDVRENDIENTFEFYLEQMRVVFDNLEYALFEGSCGYDLTRTERDKWTGEIFAKMRNFIRDTSKRNSEIEVTEEDIEEFRRRSGNGKDI